MVYHKIYHALWQVLHFAWYITKYTTHSNKFCILRGISQNIPRILTSFSSPMVYHKIYHALWQVLHFAWYITKYTTHFNKFSSPMVYHNIPRILTSFAFCVVYHKIYHYFNKFFILHGISQNIPRKVKKGGGEIEGWFFLMSRYFNELCVF